MPVVGPPRVCAVCSHVYSALQRRAQEENRVRTLFGTKTSRTFQGHSRA